jgi:hypothetical protein
LKMTREAYHVWVENITRNGILIWKTKIGLCCPFDRDPNPDVPRVAFAPLVQTSAIRRKTI